MALICLLPVLVLHLAGIVPLCPCEAKRYCSFLVEVRDGIFLPIACVYRVSGFSLVFIAGKVLTDRCGPPLLDFASMEVSEDLCS